MGEGLKLSLLSCSSSKLLNSKCFFQTAGKSITNCTNLSFNEEFIKKSICFIHSIISFKHVKAKSFPFIGVFIEREVVASYGSQQARRRVYFHVLRRSFKKWQNCCEHECRGEREWNMHISQNQSKVLETSEKYIKKHPFKGKVEKNTVVELSFWLWTLCCTFLLR